MAFVPDSERSRVLRPLQAPQPASGGWFRTFRQRLSDQPQAGIVLAGLLVATIVSFIAPASMPFLMVGLTGAAAIAFVSSGTGRPVVPDQKPAALPAELVEARRKAEEASRAKSRFLAMVSHEVRTPLNGILGMTHLLERTQLSAEQESYVEAVRRSATALFDLVADLLDFSAIEAGKFEPRRETGDLHHLIEDAIELMAPRAHEKGIDIAAAIGAGTPTMVATDHNRLRQVVFNLLGNAIKFTDAGGVMLEVARVNDNLVLTFADTGPGLARGDQQRIFEEFEQANGGKTRTHGGVGLGLSISNRIVKALGGTITVESLTGHGSRFIVTLPLAEALSPSGIDHFAKQPALAGNRVLLLVPRGQTADALVKRIAAEGGRSWHVATPSGDLAAFCADEEITDVIVDARILDRARGSIAGLPLFESGGPRRTLLVRPIEREALQRLTERGFDSWLIAPIRLKSLVSVLRGEFRALPDHAPHPDGDRLIVLDGMTRSLNILVAEDNPVNALLITNVLRKEGHSVVLVENGQQLIEQTFDPITGACAHDLLITDLAMPVMDGATAISEIRATQRSRRLPHIPVVVLSADGQNETRESTLLIGADLYLEKPIDPTSLLRLIARIAS
ncbi:response regulator [Georhizobium profundi]|uniref:Sensory/regulatory protein RpfC n=1 Tax=Georhizobium profundi TaxID=2341112 RepID=A0A3S9AYW7_9HYPH|nr:response regulator [Georhizobium profundi]